MLYDIINNNNYFSIIDGLQIQYSQPIYLYLYLKLYFNRLRELYIQRIIINVCNVCDDYTFGGELL